MQFADSSFQPVPFTVIGGFLGSGKTSLVNHLLLNACQRYAVLVNDFGALNIDTKLIQQHQGDTIALANGCICCSLAAGFSKGLGQVLDNLQGFDHVIVEASGIADPRPIQDIARIEPRLAVRGAPVVLDAQQLLQQAQDKHIGGLIHQQITAADLLLVNKQSSVSTAEARAVRYFLEQLSHAPIRFIDWGRADTRQLLSLSASPPRSPRLLNHALNHGLFSRIISADKPPASDTFDFWVKSLSSDVLRGKGLIRFSDRPGIWLWQKSGDQETLTDYSGNISGQDLPYGCELLIISKREAALPDERLIRV